jgi:transcriptional regulator with XRE-family HTH domain
VSPAALIIAARLREAIEAAETTQRKLARQLAGKGASENQVETMRRNITRWAGGKTKPDRQNAGRLARALGTPPDHFRVSGEEAANVLLDLERRVAELEAQLPTDSRAAAKKQDGEP